MNDLAYLTAAQLATGIRERQMSSAEVVDAYFARIARYNPDLNAIVTLDEDRARARARQADEALARGEIWGPFHGVPASIKDTLATEGLRTTAGFPPLADYVPPADATAVARLKAAGAIVLGKTNVPVLAADGQCSNPIFGRTNNPWDLTRTPGGSTGGGAAALAAGLSPLELGSDIAASIRLPAHYCGVYGLKPTDHRVPTTGHIPGLPETLRGVRHLQTIGPLARSIEDLELALRSIAGPDQQDWEVPPVPLGHAPTRNLRDLRLAWTDDFAGLTVTADSRRALVAFASDLDRLGCRIEQRGPDGFDFVSAWETWGELRQAEIGSTLSPELEAQQAASRGITLDSDVPMVRARARTLSTTMRQYIAALGRRDALIAALERFFESWDALLCPVSVSPAFPHWPTDTPLDVDGLPVHYDMGLIGYTCPFNLTGHPAVVLPMARSGAGLPIGIQVVGRRWRDAELLATAAALSRVLQPFQAPPGYAASIPARSAVG